GAQWLRTKPVQSQFLDNFDGSAATSIILKTYKVVAEFVPTSLQNDNPAALREIEKCSGIGAQTIFAVRWIKPAQHRKPNQRVAHAIISFEEREAANTAIRQGLNIEGRKVFAHKQSPDPNRCYGCQSLDQSHFAKDCKHEQACGTCGKPHSSTECPVEDTNSYFCVNCKVSGHAAWSRTCRSFTEARERLLATNKEAKYKYFPILNDPSSWE
ncbi:hypothetical protein L210DRAFT_3361936, partial [Boletus edulis BED1]